jgi:hypothetical protein
LAVSIWKEVRNECSFQSAKIFLTIDHCWRERDPFLTCYFSQMFEASSSHTGPSEFVVGVVRTTVDLCLWECNNKKDNLQVREDCSYLVLANGVKSVRRAVDFNKTKTTNPTFRVSLTYCIN